MKNHYLKEQMMYSHRSVNKTWGGSYFINTLVILTSKRLLNDTNITERHNSLQSLSERALSMNPSSTHRASIPQFGIFTEIS